MNKLTIISDPFQLQPGMLVREHGGERFGTSACWVIGERDEALKGWFATRVSTGLVTTLCDDLFRAPKAAFALVLLAMPARAFNETTEAA